MKLNPFKSPKLPIHPTPDQDVDALIARLNTEIPLPEPSEVITSEIPYDETHATSPHTAWTKILQVATGTACFMLSFTVTLILTAFFIINLNASLIPTTLLTFGLLGIIPSGLWFYFSDQANWNQQRSRNSLRLLDTAFGTTTTK